MPRLKRVGLIALLAVASSSCNGDAALPLVEHNDALPDTVGKWEDDSAQQAKSDYLRHLSERKAADELALVARRLSDAEQAEATETAVARALAADALWQTPTTCSRQSAKLRVQARWRSKQSDCVLSSDPLCGL